jgi:hypothetical protein
MLHVGIVQAEKFESYNNNWCDVDSLPFHKVCKRNNNIVSSAFDT